MLLDASYALAPAPVPTAAALSAVRTALRVWGVTTVVVPDQPGLPVYERGRSPAFAVGLFTAVLGRRPVYDHSAWAWSDVGAPGPPVPMGAAAFLGCTTGSVADAPSPQAVPTCVLASAG